MRSGAMKRCLPEAGEAAKTALSSIRCKDSKVAARFRGLSLTSHLQPIFSLAHQHAVGYEALLRCTDREHAALPPLEAFARCRNESDAVAMDQLCRALHLRNFAARDLGNEWLCINVNPRVFRKSESHDAFFGQLLSQLGFPARRIVVVIPKATEADEQSLKSWVDHYRHLGCLIALGDFAASCVWRLRPDFIMLDRSIIAEAAANPAARAMLPRIVSMVHEAGAMAILQGIESAGEAGMAMDSDADFVQGHYFARPDPAGETREFCDQIEKMLAGLHRVRSDAVARAQAEMMARVQAEQEAIAELVARSAAGGYARLPAVVAEPLHHLPTRELRQASVRGRRLLSYLVEYLQRTAQIAPSATH